MRKLFVLLLAVLLVGSVLGFLNSPVSLAEPDYGQIIKDDLVKIFQSPATIDGWQQAVDSNFHGAKIDHIDFIFKSESVEPYDQDSVVVVGSLDIYLRVVKDGVKMTILIQRVVAFLTDKVMGKVLDSAILGQGNPVVVPGWDGIEI